MNFRVDFSISAKKNVGGKPGVVMHAYNPISESEVGGFKANMSYIARSHLKKPRARDIVVEHLVSMCKELDLIARSWI
jgi:hypothetical protein